MALMTPTATTFKRQQPTPAGRKRNSIATPLPPTIAWLEPLALSVHVDTVSERRHFRQRDATYYTLTLQTRLAAATEPPSTWTLRRPFEDYCAFQQRLLAVLQLGHFCGAGCPWLYTFVTSYFPKPTLFRTRTCMRLAARRREVLERCFQTLQTFLLNRTNHSCTVVVERVATELLAFVLQDARNDQPVKVSCSSTDWRIAATGSCERLSSDSAASTSNDDDDSSSATASDAESSVCVLCACSLEVERHSSSAEDCEPVASLWSFASASSARYTTTLSCGHEFHDECVLLKLNESMQCPTCGAAQASY